jgi:hypothetical protein
MIIHDEHIIRTSFKMSKRVKSIFGRMNRVARVTHDFTDDVASIVIVLDNEDGSSTFSSRFLLGARMRLSMWLPVYATQREEG